jgi:sulfite exporter TauE/SafE
MLHWHALLPFLTLGLLGAAHCAGMCGGFAVSVSLASGPGRARALRRQLVYVTGKALTYGVLGALAAKAGSLVVRSGKRLIGTDAESLADLQYGLAWFAGGMMVLFGIAAMGWLPKRLTRGGGGSRWSRAVASARGLFASVRELPGDAGALGTGLLTGLLPCGWSWGALALAVTTDELTGFFGLFLFGLGTAPVLILIGLGWHGFSARFRRLASAAAGPLLIAFGVLTIARGGVPTGLRAASDAVLPPCCATEAPSESEPGPQD